MRPWSHFDLSLHSSYSPSVPTWELSPSEIENSQVTICPGDQEERECEAGIYRYNQALVAFETEVAIPN
jgi:hypothetical protein